MSTTRHYQPISVRDYLPWSIAVPTLGLIVNPIWVSTPASHCRNWNNRSDSTSSGSYSMIDKREFLLSFLQGKIPLADAYDYFSPLIYGDFSQQMYGFPLILSAAGRLSLSEWNQFLNSDEPDDRFYRSVCELGYRHLKFDESSLQARKHIILELVETHPESAVHQWPQADVELSFFDDIRSKVEKKWTTQLTSNPQSVNLVRNIAQFYWNRDEAAVRKYLHQWLQLAPENIEEVHNRIVALDQLHSRSI